MKSIYTILCLCTSFNLIAVDISDESPLSLSASTATELIVHTADQQGISEAFPNVEIIEFIGGDLENIDFKGLGELPALQKIVFRDVNLTSTEQAQLFAPLQHHKNLKLVFYTDVIKRPAAFTDLQKILPDAIIEYRRMPITI